MNIKLLQIDNIGLSRRATNALHRAGVFSVGEMFEQTEESLMNIRNIGKKSIDEILSKMEEYKELEVTGDLVTELEKIEDFDVYEDFEEWIDNDQIKKIAIRWIKEKGDRIDSLELLSTRAYNLLMFAGYEYIYQIVFLTEVNLLDIHLMDDKSASEIVRFTKRYIDEKKDDILSDYLEKQKKLQEPQELSINEMIYMDEYHDAIEQFVKSNDIDIERMGLSNRAKNSLNKQGYFKLSEFVFFSRGQFLGLKSLGVGTVDEILEKVNLYLSKNEKRIKAVIKGDMSALWDDDSVREKILNLYSDNNFQGLSFAEITEKLMLPDFISIERLKGIIGRLIADKKLEYVDYRCYKVYGKFEDYLLVADIKERDRDMIQKKLNGATLESIGKEYDVTRERVRQIINKQIKIIRNQYTYETGNKVFDEDYYRYLYETYEFNKNDATKWLGIPGYVWNYLELNDVKQGKEELKTALEDIQGVAVGLRIKIKNYLNRNKLYIDGMWVERQRADLERVVVKKLCTEDVAFDDFVNMYNEFLKMEEIPYDEKIYYTDAVTNTRKNHLQEVRFLLWKMNGIIRYYDIDGQDYSDLLDVLNPKSYVDTELSTLKFMNDYPEIMKRYDIRDQYELHNLLRKVVPEGSYHDFHCGKMPIISFGKANRENEIFDIIKENAPLTQAKLFELCREEYGFDMGAVPVKAFDKYYYAGVYTIDQKEMRDESIKLLQASLVDDFYYIDEIRNIYSGLVPNADIDEINPYNLKRMGFSVFSRYAIQNHPSLDAYFYDLLTREDIIDITEYRNKYTYVQSFSMVLMELKRSLEIIEFDDNQIINIRKLEQSGITRDMIKNYCDSVYDYVDNGTYFSASLLRQSGFQTELYDLGFSDVFYANLLISDDRFSFGTMFGTLILFKGKESITIKSFVLNLIRQHGSIDIYDLMRELNEVYGCDVHEKTDVYYKVMNTEVYYDRILERFYANEDWYYKELEEGDY